MQELIKEIKTKSGQKAFSAKSVHEFLEVKTVFTVWIQRMMEYGFIENADYQAIITFEKHENGIGGTNKVVDYALTLNTAKEISMLQRNEKGKTARQYFIEMEKLAKNPVASLTPVQVAELWLKAEKDKAALQIQNTLQEEQLKLQAPKVQYVDNVLTSESAHPITIIAKELGLSAMALNKFLKNKRVIYNQTGTWVPYAKYQAEGYTKTTTYTFTGTDGKTRTNVLTVWTEKGRHFIHNLYSNQTKPN